MNWQKDTLETMAREARFYILQELERQHDGRLSIIGLKRVLDSYELKRDRDWIETQLRKLEGLGAISMIGREGALVAKIERPGLDHLEERAILSGVMRPREAD